MVRKYYQDIANLKEQYTGKQRQYKNAYNRLLHASTGASSVALASGVSTIGTSVTVVGFPISASLECYMDWFLSLICKNYIFKYFVKTVEPTSLKFCTIIELITLHLEYTIAQVKYANFSYAHVQTFVLLNGEMATVSTGFRKLKFWLWLLWTVFYLNQTSF